MGEHPRHPVGDIVVEREAASVKLQIASPDSDPEEYFIDPNDAIHLATMLMQAGSDCKRYSQEVQEG